MPSIHQADPHTSATHAAAVARIAIESVAPQVEGGRFAAKCLANEALEVTAVIFTDGHDQIAAALLWRGPDEAEWNRVPMRALGNDRWQAWMVPGALGRTEFCIEAWQDVYATYHLELKKKYAAGVPVALEVQEGEQLLRRIADEAPEHLGERFDALLTRFADCESLEQRVAVLLDPLTGELMSKGEH
ncbi:MAG TPA: maltotransferase domain-containing protein, partial [Pseudomonas sp.]|nr:maltotransferase domain-containing protein [Pseudomonas sp.]